MILIIVFCFLGGCDDGHPSPTVLSSTKALRQYLDRGGDPNGITKQDWYKGKRTLLHRAAIYSDEEIVKMLLAAGANPNARDSTSGWTPLMIAFTTREEDSSKAGVIACLLKVSDLTIKDRWGGTAYDCAKKYGSASEVELIEEALKQHGQKP